MLTAVHVKRYIITLLLSMRVCFILRLSGKETAENVEYVATPTMPKRSLTRRVAATLQALSQRRTPRDNKLT